MYCTTYPKARYLNQANLAAQAERLGDYQQAMALWDKAGKLAFYPKDKAWCNHRWEFCEKMRLNHY